MDPREAGATALKGAAMGTADMVPGVSGGTIALIVGIYDRLVAAIAALHPRPLADVARVHDPTARDRLRAAWREMDVTFLLSLGAGMGLAVIALSQLIPIALEQVPGLTGAFFFGLIAASVVLIGRSVPWTLRRGLLAVGAAIVATAVATTTEAAAEPSLVLVFVAGAIAISAMVLPGLSGALLLLVLGQYDYLLNQLDAFLTSVAGLATGGSPSALVEPGVVVGAFMTGAVVGLLSVARAVDYALERDRATTIAALVGLMAGGLYPPGEMVVANTDPTVGGALAVLALGIVGVGVVTAFDLATDELEYVDADASVDAPSAVADAGESQHARE